MAITVLDIVEFNVVESEIADIVFDPDLITFIDKPMSRDDVLAQMTEELHAKGKIQDKDAFLTAILEREKIVSTGIGLGVAIPHAKLDDYEDFFISIAILSRKGVDWDSIDKAPVRVVFLIGGPSMRQTEYLNILSAITQRIRDDGVRNRLLHAHSPQSAIEQLSY